MTNEIKTIPSHNFFQKELIPHDATLVRNLVRKSAQSSATKNFANVYLASTACMVAAIALSILLIPAYLIRSGCEFSVKILSLQFSGAFIAFAQNLQSSGKCVLFVAFGIAFLAVGLFFPHKIYPYIEPKKLFLQNFSEILKKDLKKAQEQEKELTKKITKLELEIKTTQNTSAEPEPAEPIIDNHALEEKQKEIETLKKDKEALEEKLRKIQAAPKDNSELIAKQNEIDTLTSKMKVVSDTAATEKQTLTQQYSEEIQAKQNAIDALEKEKSDIQAAFTESQTKYQTALNEAQQKHLQVTGEKQKEIDALKNTIQVGIDALADIKQTLTKTYSEESQAKQSAIDALEKEKSALQLSLTEAQTKNQKSLNEAQQKLSQVTNEKQNEIDALKSKIQVASDAAAKEKQTLIQKHSEELLAKQNALAALEKEKNDLQKFVQETQKEIQTIKQNITRLTVENQKEVDVLTRALKETLAEKQKLEALNKKTQAAIEVVSAQVPLPSAAISEEKAPEEASKKEKLINHPSAVYKYTLMFNEYKFGLKFHNEDLDKLFKSTPSDSPVYRLLEILNCPQDPKMLYKDDRDRYQNHFIPTLRNIISSEQYKKAQNESLSKLVQTICYVRWSYPNIYSYLKSIVELATGKIEEDQKTSLSDRVFARNKKVIVMKEQPALWKQQGLGAVGLKDYTGSENTPHVRSLMSYSGKTSKRTIYYLRHGSPTTSGSVLNVTARLAIGAANKSIEVTGLGANVLPRPASGEEIATDYVEFIAAARARKESILYCIHQRMKEDQLEDESVRVRKILELQDYNPNFFAFVQALEGNLFDKKGKEFSKIQNFEELKAAILNDFDSQNKNRNCNLPKVLENDQKYRSNILPRLLSDVHRLFFDKRKQIKSLEEWQSFILFFYVFQKIDLKFRLPNVKFYTTACKDFLDRGGSMAWIEERLHDFWNGKENDAAAQEERIVNTIGPAILVKKKKVLENRLKPALEADKILCSLSDAQLKQWREYRFENGWKCDGIAIPKNGNQTNWNNISK